MGKLIYVPLEVIPSRYSEMVLEMMKEVSDIILLPDVSVEPPKPGKFLNFAGSCQFKAHQLAQITQLFLDSRIEDGDAFLFADLWFPGLEMVRYIADSENLKIKIGAINHAGRADSTDFINSFGPWADHIEHALHHCCDYVFVGSEFHRKQVLDYLGDNPTFTKRVIATGQPFSESYMHQSRGKGLEVVSLGEWLSQEQTSVVWPHRIADEKNPRDLFQLAHAAPDVQFEILSGISLAGDSIISKMKELPNIRVADGLTKKEYYQKLSDAKAWLSTAKQETFGYSLHEALAFGLPIIAPHRACYPEIAGRTGEFHCYTSLNECIELCRNPWTRPDTDDEKRPSYAYLEYLETVPKIQREILCG